MKQAKFVPTVEDSSQLEKELEKLKKLYAEQALEREILKDLLIRPILAPLNGYRIAVLILMNTEMEVMLKKLWYVIGFSFTIVGMLLGYFSNNEPLKIIVLNTGCFILAILRIMLYVSNKREKKDPPS
ncbi:hypothetical protein [Paenibacillus larvae]|uniref:hypothetical protein n=1 Tax=Paenibacillus larvae TaxID=1464 RepID=UPI002853E924|nr:hypothetical protein [Paenibacillus larvae]MDR5598172.1 hypothetical protein [Paenibacillus larvae]